MDRTVDGEQNLGGSVDGEQNLGGPVYSTSIMLSYFGSYWSKPNYKWRKRIDSGKFTKLKSKAISMKNFKILYNWIIIVIHIKFLKNKYFIEYFRKVKQIFKVNGKFKVDV